MTNDRVDLLTNTDRELSSFSYRRKTCDPEVHVDIWDPCCDSSGCGCDLNTWMSTTHDRRDVILVVSEHSIQDLRDLVYVQSTFGNGVLVNPRYVDSLVVEQTRISGQQAIKIRIQTEPEPRTGTVMLTQRADLLDARIIFADIGEHRCVCS